MGDTFRNRGCAMLVAALTGRVSAASVERVIVEPGTHQQRTCGRRIWGTADLIGALDAASGKAAGTMAATHRRDEGRSNR